MAKIKENLGFQVRFPLFKHSLNLTCHSKSSRIFLAVNEQPESVATIGTACRYGKPEEGDRND